MNKKKLAQYFNEYLISFGKEAKDEQGGLIYTKEDFNINIKNKTIYLKDFGVVTKTEDFKEGFSPDWLGYYMEDIQTTGIEDIKIIIGYGNPYSVENSQYFPNKSQVGFIPYHMMKKLKNKV